MRTKAEQIAAMRADQQFWRDEHVPSVRSWLAAAG
jgi:hypothetical protein